MRNPSTTLQLQFLAMDFLNEARKDPSTRPLTYQHHIKNAYRQGLTVPAIAAGLGRPVSFVESLLTDGGI
ncbi:hypothetical protein AB0N65_11725 [Paenarthrobacter sp. NPDC089322]|uniref:hypothetical protein n=1 Tax=Paenarthrobacter sp. NPDC089322 TaxID=3155065 RepID=UPI00341D78E3